MREPIITSGLVTVFAVSGLALATGDGRGAHGRTPWGAPKTASAPTCDFPAEALAQSPVSVTGQACPPTLRTP